MPIWLAGWFFALIKAGGSLLKGDGGPPEGFLIFWVIGWTFGGIFAIMIFLWNVAGKEVATFDSISLEVARIFAFIKFKKKYAIGSCEKFRVDPIGTPSSSNRGFSQMTGYGSGRLVFDYGMKTVKFGAGIDEAEAGYIINLLQNRGFIKK